MLTALRPFFAAQTHIRASSQALATMLGRGVGGDQFGEYPMREEFGDERAAGSLDVEWSGALKEMADLQ